MTGKIRLVILAMAVAGGLLAVAPAALADTEVTNVSYACADLGTETLRIGGDGTVHIRGITQLGESESDDARFDGLFRQRLNADLYPDGTASIWGTLEQRSHTYDGAWKFGYRADVATDGSFLGTASGSGIRAFAGLDVSGNISPHDGSGSPCNPVLAASTFTGIVFD